MSQPYMQLYVADYLGDTRHLTTEQHGAYLLLLMTMWRADGALPNDDRKLARVTGCTASRWSKIKDEVLEFFEVADGEITHKRLKFELEKASEKSIKRAEAGSRGGQAKALKSNKPTVANATDLLCHSSEPEPDREANASLNSPSSAPSKADVARGFLEFWTTYPRKVGKDAAARSFAKAMARADGPDPAATILDGLRRALPGWDDPEFIPHPTTWLNQGRWTDEAPTPATPRRAEPQNVRTDRHSAQHNHLSAVARAMAAAVERPEGEHGADRSRPGFEGGSEGLPEAA